MELIKEIEKVHNNIKIKNYKEAAQRCNRLIKKYPDNAYLYNLAGLALQQFQRVKASVSYFQKAIDLEPKNVAAKNNLANTLKVLGKFDLAEKLYNEVLKLDPNHIKCLNNYANLKSHLADYKGAIEFYNKALKVEPDNITVLMSLASAYHSIANFDKAIEIINKILKINQNIMSAHKLLSSINDYKVDSSHLDKMLLLSKQNNLKNDQKIDLFFAIGKAQEDIGEYENSFQSFKLANKFKREIINFDINKEKELFISIKNAFSDLDLSKKINNNFKEKIIFICGMPRSGTTLVEQIIASNSNVDGAGELFYLQQAVKDNFINDNIIDKKALLEDINAERIKVAKDYFDLLKIHSLKNSIVTDKAPQNFRWLGFIKIFFPNSKIIHCTRNPKDTCLSLYKNSFASSDMNWSYSDSDIANYYNLYKNLMKFWNSIMGDSIHELNYEKLVNYKDDEIKKMLTFCELEHQESCFNHHKNTSTPIKTVSVTQARNPIYSSSVNKNEFYKNNLNHMFSLLD
tara:strand:+ start:1630 stop:3177 length:1548 start_codon:yes stop_codon:yes gene_type:complete